MPKKTFTTEQIISKLREAEVLISQGQTVPAVCKVIGVTEQTYYRWRKAYGGDEDRPGAAAARIGAREQLSEAVSCRFVLDNAIIKEALRGK